MKSGSGSAVAFGRVLQAVRKRSPKGQAEVASSFDPKLSVAAISMAESGNRPPKTEEMVRGYAAALELDEDELVELWWAMQGMVKEFDRVQERDVPRWWRELRPDPEVEAWHLQLERRAEKVLTPNEGAWAPSMHLMALSEKTCEILKNLLGNSWEVRSRAELGRSDSPVDGHPAVVIIELLAREAKEGDSNEPPDLMVTFACPEPASRPAPPEPTTRPDTGALSPDVAWILSSVDAMPARERAAVAAFIHGLREGANLFSEAAQPPPQGQPVSAGG